MFANFAKSLREFFTTENQERESYLASSVDFADLEHRIHAYEMNHQPFTMYPNDRERDWHV